MIAALEAELGMLHPHQDTPVEALFNQQGFRQHNCSKHLATMNLNPGTQPYAVRSEVTPAPITHRHQHQPLCCVGSFPVLPRLVRRVVIQSQGTLRGISSLAVADEIIPTLQRQIFFYHLMMLILSVVSFSFRSPDSCSW